MTIAKLPVRNLATAHRYRILILLPRHGITDQIEGGTFEILLWVVEHLNPHYFSVCWVTDNRAVVLSEEEEVEYLPSHIKGWLLRTFSRLYGRTQPPCPFLRQIIDNLKAIPHV
jgi:hypothetical protein